MDKGLECGIRFTKELALLPDDKWREMLPRICERCLGTIRTQRDTFLKIESVSSKDANGINVGKGVELYCRIKGDAEIVEEKVGFECGIRIKQYVLEFSDAMFDTFLKGVKDTLSTTLTEQRAAFLAANSSKSIDLSDIGKGVEIYCGTKSMCA